MTDGPTNNPFELENGDIVMMNECCEFAEVVARLDEKGQEPKYKVYGTSVIDGDLTGWFTFSELTT